jgi:predicted transcriptional regulator
VNRKRKKLTDDSRLLKTLVNTEEWPLGEIRAGLAELDGGRNGHSRTSSEVAEVVGAAQRTTTPATAVRLEILLAVLGIQ